MSISNFCFENVGGIEGLKVISPFLFEDSRGEFRKLYEHNLFSKEGIHFVFSELDENISHKGVLRGLHMQHTKPQSKLARVICGAAYDVAVDLRKGSNTYGKYYGVYLTAENRKLFFIPEGFLHGCLALTDNTVFSYLCGNDYNSNYDSGVRWDDPDIGIKWPSDGIQNLIMSEKDQSLPSLKEYEAKYTW